MAQPNISLKAYGGTEKESFHEFERLLRSIIGVAAIDAGQQANFLSLHLKDAALRYFQTLDAATRADLDLSLTALRNHFCNPQLQELHVIKLESIKFDTKTDTPENFLVTLQNMALRAYPDPTPAVVPPADPAIDADDERDRIEAANAENAQNLLFAQREREHQIKRYFKKCMPSWLRAKLLEQPETTTVEDLCLLARKQLTIHNLCKIDDYGEGVFSEMSSTISENLVTALSKLTQTQESMENKVNALTKQFEEQIQVREQQSSGSGSSYNNRGSRGRYRGNRGYRGRYNYRGKNYRGQGSYNYQNNYPTQQFVPAQFQSDENSQNYNAQAETQPSIQITPPEPQNHIVTTQYAQVFCYKCGYPNHLASQCSLGRGGRRRGGSNFPFQKAPKNY